MNSPAVSESEIKNSKRTIKPIIIDTYSLFDKKIEEGSDWRIIGHQDNYTPENIDDIYFAFGIGDSCKKKDFFVNVTPISSSEWDLLPKLSPKGDFDVKKILSDV